MNKKYRQGAEDVAEIAEESHKITGDKTSKVADDLQNYNENQNKVNNSLINHAEDHEKRIYALESKFPAINLDLIDKLPPEKRALLGGIIRSVSLNDSESRFIANLIISKFGVEPLQNFILENIVNLTADEQKLCTYYLYILLKKSKNNEETKTSVNEILDEFIISNKEKKNILSIIDSYDTDKLADLINIRKVGKQNVIVMGKPDAISASLINSVLGKIAVNEGFNQNSDEIPEELSSNESNIMFCGVFEIGYESDKNLAVLKKAEKIIQTRADANRVSYIWYCINAMKKRIEQYEIDLINMLANSFKSVNIIVVFDRCINKNNATKLTERLRESLSSACRPVFINVLTELFEADGGVIIEPFGINDLISATTNL